MVAQKINIPEIQDHAIEGDIILKPVKIYHQDGGSETAYVQSSATDKKAPSLHSHLAVIYMSVAIIALTISAFVAIHRLKHT